MLLIVELWQQSTDETSSFFRGLFIGMQLVPLVWNNLLLDLLLLTVSQVTVHDGTTELCFNGWNIFDDFVIAVLKQELTPGTPRGEPVELSSQFCASTEDVCN